MGTRTKKKGEDLNIRTIRLDDIYVPEEYQRPLDEKRYKEIAAEFNPEECGVLPVTDRGDGTYVTTDSNHRFHALKLLGYEDWTCQVMSPRSLPEEAKTFVRLNTTPVSVTGKAKWRARRVAKDPVVLDIEAVVDSLGLNITDGKKTSWRDIQATSALERIYISMGAKHLEHTLRTIATAWPEDPDLFKSAVVLGTASFLYYYRDDPMFRRNEVADKWSAFPLRKIIQSAAGLSEAISGGTSATYSSKTGLSWAPGIQIALVQAYNYKRSTRQIELPTLKGWKAVGMRNRAEAENRTTEATE